MEVAEQGAAPVAQRNTQKWAGFWVGIVAGLTCPGWVDPALVPVYLTFCGGLCGLGALGSVANNRAMR